MLSYDNKAPAHYGSIRSIPLSSTSYSHQKSRKVTPIILDPIPRHLFILTGPAGCGKTTVAKYLADQFDFPFVEGDDYHSEANLRKMKAQGEGPGLTDGDRWDWLQKLRKVAVRKLEDGASGVIVTCSALKEKYRDVIRVASYNDHNVHVHFIYLRGSLELLTARVEQRSQQTSHFFQASRVKSQFDDLEEPDETETDVFTIDVSGLPSDVEKQAWEAVASVIEEEQ